MKLFVNEITEVPEGSQSEYEATNDGRFRLKVEGDVPEVQEANARVAEFRDNNIGLMKKVEEVASKLKTFEGIDPSEYTRLKGRVSEFEKAGDSPADFELRLTTAVKNAVEPLQTQLIEIQTREKDAKEALARKNVESKLVDVARKANVRKSAVSDFLARGANVFDLEGKAFDGDRPRYSKKNPADVLTMDEWAVELMQDAPHLFEDSKGGGAGSSSSAGNSGNHGRRVISGSDPLEVGRHLEDLASGKTTIQ